MSDLPKYFRIFSFLLTGALLLALAVPLATLYFDSLSNLSLGLRYVATATTVVVLVAGILLLARDVLQMGIIAILFVLGATTATMLAKVSSDDSQPATSSASILYSDGSLVNGVPPADTNLWGRRLATYGLHPMYDSAQVPETLIAQLEPSLRAIRVLVSKPRDALFLPDGSPTNSDGITLEMLAKGQDGQLLTRRLATVTQEAFLEHRWITLELSGTSTISEVAIKVLPGPPGSTPAYDSTLLAIQQLGGWRSTLFFAGKVVLSGLAAFVLAMFGTRLMVLLTASVKSRHWLSSIRLSWPHLIFGVSVLAIVYWSASYSTYVYYFDYRVYWAKTEQIFELITSGSWGTLGSTIIASLPDDYTMIPALLTAIIAVPIGYPNQLVYVISISLIYVIPAYLITAYIADRIFIKEGETAWDSASLRMISAFAVLFGAPAYLTVALNLMPDAGGVVITIAAMLVACRLSRTIGHGLARTNPWRLAPGLAGASLGLGVLLSAMFLFRRWYVFAAAGIALAGLLMLGYDLLRRRKQTFEVLVSAALAIILIATAALSILSWVMFDWAASPASHDYVSLYAAYQKSHSYSLNFFLNQFGVVAPFLTILVLVSSLFMKADRRLLFFVAAPSMIAALLFLQIQGPGLQHFYLLMPLIGVGIAGISSILMRRKGTSWGLALLGVLMLGTLGATVHSPYREQVSRAFPSLELWMPKHQKGLEGLTLLGDWLVSPEIKTLRFCLLASSSMINQSVLAELWQVAPSLEKNDFSQRMIFLGEVDSRDGPPSRALAQCEVILVGTPPQTHLAVGQQYSIVLPAQDLDSGKGIGAAYERLPVTFRLDEQVDVVPFRRVRPLEEAEYQDLVSRFSAVSGRRNLPELPNSEAKSQTE